VKKKVASVKCTQEKEKKKKATEVETEERDSRVLKCLLKPTKEEKKEALAEAKAKRLFASRTPSELRAINTFQLDSTGYFLELKDTMFSPPALGAVEDGQPATKRRKGFSNKNFNAKGLWTPDEDERVRQYVAQYGTAGIAQLAGDMDRCSKQVRSRWFEVIDPAINREEWSPAEDDFIISMQATVGNKWSKMESFLDHRPQTHVKDRYTKNLKKKKKALVVAVVQRSRALPVPAPAPGVFDPLVEWCAELGAPPIGLPSSATNNDSSSDSESAQLLSFLSRRWSNEELPTFSTGRSGCPFGASFEAGTAYCL
jgi:hypothetical protein